MGSGLSKKKKAVPQQNGQIPNSQAGPPPPQQPVKLKDVQGPQALAAAQKHYAASYQGPPPKDASGNIPPFPTPDSKDKVINPKHMEDIDVYVQSTPHDLAVDDLNKLVHHLIKARNDDVSRLRALYKWLTSQKLEEYDIGHVPPVGSALHELLLVQGRTQNLNHVFKKMCNMAKIPCRLVKGSTRPQSYYYGGELIAGHAWCAVFVRNAWRLIDAHLGVNYSKFDTDYDQNSAPRRTPREPSDKAGPPSLSLHTYDYTDFFFLTDPHVFIYYNLPNDDRWQLLATQVSPQLFKDMVYLTPQFFLKGIKNVSEGKGIVSTNNGESTFEIHFETNHALRCSYHIEKLTGLSSTSKTTHGDLNAFGFVEIQGDKRLVHFNMKETGRYYICLYVMDLVQTPSKPSLIAHYFLDVNAPDFIAHPLPKNSRSEYGPGADTAIYGVTAVSHKQAVITTDNGQVLMEFKWNKERNLTFSPELSSQNTAKEQLEGFIRSSIDDDGTLQCFIKFPNAGKYMFRLLVNADQQASITNICTYYLISKVGNPDPDPFPSGVKGFIGIVSAPTSPLLKPVSHPRPLIRCDSTGELTIEMETEYNLDLQTALELCQPSRDEDLSDYTWYSFKEKKLNVDITFPEAGQYGLSIFAKEKGKEGLLKHMFRYIILVDKPHQEAVPYPSIHSGWNPDCKIRSPLWGYLAENQPMTFEVLVPRAKDVSLLTSNWAGQSLQAEDDGWSKREISTGQGGSSIILAASYDNKNYVYLLEYKILSFHEQQKVLARQKQAISRAATRTRAMDKKSEDEVKAANNREKELNAQASAEETDFIQDKDRIAEEEDRFRQQELEKWKRNISQMSSRVLVRTDNGHSEAEIVQQELTALDDAKNSDLSTRRSIHKGMKTYLVRERLREGTRLQNIQMLKPALQTFRELGLEEKDQDVTKAKKTLDHLEAKQGLHVAMESGDAVLIQDALDTIQSHGLYGRLQADVQEAERLLAAIQRINRLKLTVLGMDKGTMTEVKSYISPPEGVKLVMQASLLLLGEDEYTTGDWRVCKQLFTVVGPDSIHKQILDLNLQSLHPEIVARVREILDPLDLTKVKKISAGAAAFYVWAMGTVEEAENIQLEHGNPLPPSANIPRQREILDKASIGEKVAKTFKKQQEKSNSKQYRDWVF